MMLKAVLAYILHQSLQTWDLHDGAAPKRFQRIIHKGSVSHVGTEPSVPVIAGNARIAQWPGRRPPCYRPGGILGAQRGGKDLSIGHFHIAQEAFGPIAAVEQHTFVWVIPVVVVPVH